MVAAEQSGAEARMGRRDGKQRQGHRHEHSLQACLRESYVLSPSGQPSVVWPLSPQYLRASGKASQHGHDGGQQHTGIEINRHKLAKNRTPFFDSVQGFFLVCDPMFTLGQWVRMDRAFQSATVRPSRAICYRPQLSWNLFQKTIVGKTCCWC